MGAAVTKFQPWLIPGHMHKPCFEKRQVSLTDYRRSRLNIASEITRRLRTLFALTGVLVLVGVCLISSKCYARGPVHSDDPTYNRFKLGSNVRVLLHCYWNS